MPFLKVNKLRESKSEEFVIRGDSDRYYWVQVEGEKIGEGDWWNEVAVFWNSDAQIWKGMLFLKHKGLKFDICSYSSVYFVNL